MTGEHSPRTRAHVALEAVALGSVAVTTRALLTVSSDLTFGQWRALVIVGEHAGGATVSEIATRLGAEISPVSRLVSRLVGRGLLLTAKDARDRRVTRVSLTEAGHELRETVLERRRAILGGVLEDAGPIEPEVAAALERIGRAFREYL
jgi:DNA-binding MarR family transcriptional regulator